MISVQSTLGMLKLGWGTGIGTKLRLGEKDAFVTVFFFRSCMTFVIDNLILKLCEPQFKLRTLWKIRIGDVFREERF